MYYFLSVMFQRILVALNWEARNFSSPPKKSYKIMFVDQRCQEPLLSYSIVAVFVIALSMPESNALIQNAKPVNTTRDLKYNNHVVFLSFG